MYKLAPHEASCLAEHSVSNSEARPGSSPGWDWTPTTGAEGRAQVPPQGCLQCCKDVWHIPASSPFPKNCLSGGTVTDRDQLLTHRDAKAEMLLLTLNCFGTQHDTSPQLRHDHFQEFRQTKCVWLNTPKKHSRQVCSVWLYFSKIQNQSYIFQKPESPCKR